jgi:hypothetical protein
MKNPIKQCKMLTADYESCTLKMLNVIPNYPNMYLVTNLNSCFVYNFLSSLDQEEKRAEMGRTGKLRDL